MGMMLLVGHLQVRERRSLFGLPLIQNIPLADPHLPTGLILTPTRELAEQIFKVLRPLAKRLRRSIGAIYGGVSYSKQLRMLDDGVDILVACPGRLLDLMSRGSIKSLKHDFCGH